MTNITSKSLGHIGSEEIILYTLTNSKGASAELMNLGATIVAINVHDREDKLRDVVLGFASYETYMNDGAALGKSVGRFANRIAKGHFTLDGKEYPLAINNGPNHLHGGPTGFMNRVWASSIEGEKVIFTYTAQDGEEGYPSQLEAKVEYEWSEECELKLGYFATTDGATIVNLTNHVYFNLNGEGNGDIHEHTLKLYAEKFLPTDPTQIPTGELAPVAGTPMDFREAKALGADIEADYEPLVIGHGYDHCWALDKQSGAGIAPAAELYSEQSGIKLEVSTTQPGVQIYTGNWLTGCGVAKAGHEHKNRDGVAIECQNFPDSPNQSHFPSPVLRAGESYEQHIAFKFSK